MDSAEERRSAYKNNESYREYRYPKNPNPMIPNLSEEDAKSQVEYTTRYVKHRNLNFLLQKWVPLNPIVKSNGVDEKNAPKAVLFFVHGYGGTSLFNWALYSRNLCLQNFIVFAMDGMGHGLSDGLHAFIPDFRRYAQDFKEIYYECAAEYPNLKKFITCVSMGGAVTALILEMDTEEVFSGAVFLSPMLSLSDELQPNSFSRFLLSSASFILPRAAITPSKEITNDCYQDQDLADYIRKNKIFYSKRARLGTANEMVNVCSYLPTTFKDFKRPMLIMHGTNDLVTSYKMSERFVESAASEDKTLKLFPDQGHALLLEGVAEEAFNCIVKWIDNRVN